ncbi:hypothetical protein [Candidatus Steffania adelgidicola]|uniref:hypothetical protein n=1 Tax=Candidatus Steffania adelgidicola TaxID=1076626 RepID=UPI001D007EDE|nr:hypothetical protein [Candidatus Steffania adelgidicola]
MSRLIQPNWHAPALVRACCSTSCMGGISKQAAPGASRNLSNHVKDAPCTD